MWIEQFAQDLRYGCRSLRQSRAFLATTVLTLGVAIGLVSVAYTVVDTYVLRPYAVENPYSLHQIAWRSPDGGGQSFRWRDFEELRGRQDLFSAVVAESTRFVSWEGRPLAAALVSDNYFETLRPRVLLGRAFGSADRGSGVVVLSEQGWARFFAEDPAAVGRDMRLNDQTFTIVGVLRPEFTGLGDMPRDLWIPLTAYARMSQPVLLGAGGPRAIQMVARLQPAVTAEQAGSALSAFVTRAIDDRQDVRGEVRLQASPNPLSLEMLAVLSPVSAAFGLVLVTACANVSNVMLARGNARHREIAVRLSLGASRGRIVRQLLTEGLLISLLSGLAALFVAAWVLRAIAVTFFGTLPPSVAALLRLAPLGIDSRVFLFTLIVAAIATLLFALLPALRASSLKLTDALHGQGTGTRRSTRLRGALVVSQVAVSLVLVIVALTLARNGAAIGAIDLGYDTKAVMSVNVRGEDNTPVRPLAAVLATDPRIVEVAVTGGNPLFVRTRAVTAAADGTRRPIATRYTFVSPEYFSILRIPIVRGRSFRQDEAKSAAHVAIVSAATAAAFWPGDDPIGKLLRIEMPDGRPVDELPGYSQVVVVGTAPDVVSGILMDGRDDGHIYLPLDASHPRAAALLVRGRSERDMRPDSLQQRFRQAAADPEVFEALPLEEMRALQMYPFRAASWVGSVLGVIALGLSVSGLYGVLTYTLSQRTKEIGIRMALGATAAAVVGLVVRQSARLSAVGAVIGLTLAGSVLKVLGSAIQMRHVSFLDLVAFACGLAIIIIAALLAAYHPARRASRVDPSEALRADA